MPPNVFYLSEYDKRDYLNHIVGSFMSRQQGKVSLFGSKEVSNVFGSFAKYNWQNQYLMDRIVVKRLDELANTRELEFIQTAN